MYRRVRIAAASLILAVVALALAVEPGAAAVVNVAPPAAPVKLIFIHHSTGEAWLADGHGGLGLALRDNNYFVSDTNYGWGPDAIGDRTDIGHWWSWFRDPATAPAATAALYAESGRHCDYSRLAVDPGGQNQVVVFKSCFPNSELSGPESPVPAIADNPLKGQAAGGAAFTVANAKGIYNDLLGYFGAHPEKLFVAVVAPPVTSPDTPGGRALADWLVDHWLQDAGYATGNVFVFDFYTVLSSKTGAGASDVGLATGNHHRVWSSAVQHKTDDGADRLAYPSAGGDSHPNAAGDQKATAELVPLLNNAYNAWRASSVPPVITVAPTGAATKTRGTSLAVSWTTDQPVSSGEFAVWAVSSGGWYIGRIVRQNGTAAYATGVTLSIPVGGPYRVRVGWRPLVGSGAFTTLGAAADAFTVLAPAAPVDLWVDPVAGSDAAAGTTRAAALRTLTEAWDRVPSGAPLAAAHIIRLLPGRFTADMAPSWMESRHGTSAAPLTVTAADGPGTVVLPALDIYDCSYLRFVDVGFESGGTAETGGGNTLHFASCDHLLLDRCTLTGLGDIDQYTTPQETLKANQCSYVTVEDCDISGAWNPALDFVAVQYGSILRNRIHHAGDWGIYLKGGSAYFTIAGNEIYDCVTGGFSAGQGTGFEYMVSPWIHYEVTDIKFVNNVVHDTEGAGMGVNGGYNILLAWNTLYRVGRRSHAIELVHGVRGCGGNTARCLDLLAEGGWGTAVQGDAGSQPIPNRNVFVFNNLLVNPDGYQSAWCHFALRAPETPAAGSNIPSPARADENVVIRGNVLWNGPADLALGIGGEGNGGQPDNPTCNAALVLAQNAVNTVRPELVDPAGGDFRIAGDCDLRGAPTVAVPGFAGGDRPARPLAPEGDLSNAVAADITGSPRAAGDPPGAYRLAGPATSRLQPSRLVYRGAFRLPGPSGGSSWAYSGDGLTYYPDGDSGGTADGYPGSLFGIGHDWQHAVAAGELAANRPQPYAVLPLDPYLFGGRSGQEKHHVAAIAFDRAHCRLFLVEPFATGGDAIVHVWEIG